MHQVLGFLLSVVLSSLCRMTSDKVPHLSIRDSNHVSHTMHISNATAK